MTRNDLEKANELDRYIRGLEDNIRWLTLNIEDYDKFENKSRYGFHNRFLRLCNFCRGMNKPEEPGVFLFNGVSIHGHEIPFSRELLVVLKNYAEKMLATKEQEFKDLVNCREE